MSKPKNVALYKARAFYHIYDRGNHKGKIFYKEDDYTVFVNLIYKYIRASSLLLIAYCLMPNHYHLVLKSGDNTAEISKFMQKLMTAYVMYFNRKYLKVGHLFQGPFQVRMIVGRKDLQVVLGYLRQNPVEAGIAEEKGDSYKWLYISEKGQT